MNYILLKPLFYKTVNIFLNKKPQKKCVNNTKTLIKYNKLSCV